MNEPEELVKKKCIQHLKINIQRTKNYMEKEEALEISEKSNETSLL